MALIELLLAEGLVDDAAIDRACARAKVAGRPLVEVLVDDGIPEDVLADLVARSVGTVVFDLANGTLDAEAVHLLPESLARRHLAVAVAPDPSTGTLRVAFADPLDVEATTAVRDATGLDIAALVGTVSGIKAVLDREFGSRERIELPPETTRRVDAVVRSSTAPAHRIAEEATIEQRHEALLLALIESGALERADYVNALRRLLGKKD